MVVKTRISNRRPNLTKSIVICCILFFLLALMNFSLVLGQSEEWLSIEDEFFVINYKEGYRSDAALILEYCQFARNVVMEAYPHTLSMKVVVFLYLYPNEYASYYSCSAHVSLTEASLHFITPTIGKEKGGPWVDDLWYKGEVIHEYTHVPFWIDVYKSGKETPPSWFSQGMAEYLKMFRSNIPGILQKYEWNLRKVANKVKNGDGYLWSIVGDVYYGGAYIVKYMYEKYGQGKVISLVKSDVKFFTQALEKELEITGEEFEDNWLKWACEEFDADPNLYVSFESYEGKQLYEELLSNYNELNTTYHKLTEDYASLNSSYYDLRADYSDLLSGFNGLKRDYDGLNSSYNSLLADYDSLKANYDGLESRYNDLESKYQVISELGELGTTRSLMYIFITTTIIFIATTVYFVKRKPKAT